MRLQPQDYYEDFYDEITVGVCRRLASYKSELTDNDLSKLKPEQVEATKVIKADWLSVVAEMSTFMYAAERYNGKSAAVTRMMDEDREQDRFYTEIQPTRPVRCRECLSTGSMKLISKDAYWRDDPKKRVLFMFRCGECNTNTGYFDDGEQYFPEPELCPNCRSEEHTFTKSRQKHTLTITYTCLSCDHVWFDAMDFTSSRKEKPDPQYVVDRKLYCYSDKVRQWAKDMRRTRPLFKSISERRNQRAEVDKTAEALKKIKKQTVAQVLTMLTKTLSAHDYAQLQFGVPNMSEQLTVPFTIMDKKVRSADDCTRELQKVITKVLECTNWRLVNTSLGYRAGYSSGKLQAYETEAELQKLAS